MLTNITMDNNDDNFLVFSHEQDVDGLFSAAVLKMVYPQSEVILTNYGFENMVAIKEKIVSFVKSFNSGTVIISDIGINDESYLPVYEALTFSKQKGFSNIWIDHHVWSIEMEEIFSTICEMILHSEKRATELCIERFAPANACAKTLGSVAHRTDFPDSVRFPLPPLTGLISYYLGKKELNHKLYSVILDNVCRGILWNTEMQDDMIEASRLIDESIMKSINSMVVKEFDLKSSTSLEKDTRRIRVAIAKADSFVSRSVLLGKVIDDNEIDLAIAYTPEGKLSLRRGRELTDEDTQIDCSAIASAFREGGGHPGAAGGFLRGNVDHNSDTSALNEIENTVKNYFDKLVQKSN
jgi:hypothetical protein